MRLWTIWVVPFAVNYIFPVMIVRSTIELGLSDSWSYMALSYLVDLFLQFVGGSASVLG